MDRSFIRDLVALAKLRSDFNELELKLLHHAAADAGISNSELKFWIDNAEEIRPALPHDSFEEENMLIYMLRNALKNGGMDQNEFALLKILSVRLEHKSLNEAIRLHMNKSNLKNLVTFICGEEEISNKKKQALINAAMKAGLSKVEIHEVLDNITYYKNLHFENSGDKEILLIQMVSLALANGKVNEDIYDLCKMAADKLGYREEDLKMVISLSGHEG